jgi:hypothetical protein
VVTEKLALPGLAAMRMGNSVQRPLNKSGDDVRIDWGYVYLAAKGEDADVCAAQAQGMTFICAEAAGNALFLFAYDDIDSIEYFGEACKAYWKQKGACVEELLCEEAANYEVTMQEAVAPFARRLLEDAREAGGEEYAALLALAVRQVMAAHKLAVNSAGELLYISKECFSNGCAATADVSYPSIPMYLIYRPELILGMLRPIFRYARSDVWRFDFAPHDCGQYPLLNGQVYSDGTKPQNQMPIEECGNMLVMTAAASLALGNADFAREQFDLLKAWASYLLAHGADPENQLCTDDFAGHLAHNCNLTLKAIMGIAGFALLCGMLGETALGEAHMQAARVMAADWERRAANGDGSYRLAFDKPGTFSMKYNAVWDQLFGTGLFSREMLRSELAGNLKHINQYGLPLDSRETYTKSDWLVWTAAMLEEKENFRRMLHPLWEAYHTSASRVPMTDWYDTITAAQCGFQHRTVQGGLFIKLLAHYGLKKREER